MVAEKRKKVNRQWVNLIGQTSIIGISIGCLIVTMNLIYLVPVVASGGWLVISYRWNKI